MALFITLGLISRPSVKMLSLAQHADYAQHLSVYAVSCTVLRLMHISLTMLILHLSTIKSGHLAKYTQTFVFLLHAVLKCKINIVNEICINLNTVQLTAYTDKC
jgi:hypothetical protein